jgi:dTDP-4-amino-4,6-dideoxygalactose transaminase
MSAAEAITADAPALERPVAYVDFPAQYESERDEIQAIVARVFHTGQFIGGPEVAELERALAALCGVGHVVTLNSGTDALTLALSLSGVRPGTEVITPPNSFVASTATIRHLGAKPVFVDVLPDQSIDPALIEAAITPNTRVIMPVHLTGRIVDMNPILAIAERHGLTVIEDAAQSIGSRYRGRPAGSFGRFGCFSTHPLKNLNAAGDGGFITTDDGEAAERLRRLRNHGMLDRDTVLEWGHVSRMDTLQAAILLMRLRKLDEVIAVRRRNAALYQSLLDPAHVFCPPCREVEFNTFHTFVIQVDRRDALQAHLKGLGIGSAVHYPTPLHLQPAARELGHRVGDFPVCEAQAGRILSLPVHQHLTERDIARVATAVNRFHGSSAS